MRGSAAAAAAARGAAQASGLLELLAGYLQGKPAAVFELRRWKAQRWVELRLGSWLAVAAAAVFGYLGSGGDGLAVLAACCVVGLACGLVMRL